MNPFNKYINNLKTKLPAYNPQNSFTRSNLPQRNSRQRYGTYSNPKNNIAGYSSFNQLKSSLIPTAGATSTNTPLIKPATDTTDTTNIINTLPNSGQQYVGNISNTTQNAYDAVTGARTNYGASQGLPNMLGGKQINETTSNIIQTPKKESAYIEYLKSMFNPEQTKISLQKAEADYKRLTDIQNRKEAKELEARRLYEETLDRSGGLLSGAQQAARGVERSSNQELADLALQESAAARSAGVSQGAYSQLLDLGKELYGEEQPIEIGGVLYSKEPDGTYQALTQGEVPSISDQYGTGSIGEYNFAKANGYTGSFSQYQNEDANRKMSIAKAGVGGMGLTPSQINTTVNSVAGAFDNEPIVKAYNTVQEGFQTINSIGVNTKSPADDIAFIYAFAKIMDPNSVVREGEYNTIQKYAQTWANNFGFKAQRIFSNTNFLTASAKQKMLNALKPKVDTITKQYENLNSEYQRQIQDAYAGRPRKITNYAAGNIPQNTPQADPNWLTNYNYDADIQAAQQAIESGADPEAVRQRLLQKYQDVDL